MDCYSLELINSKINEIVVQKNQYISDKEDKSAHGIGISSIRDIVEKYEGTLDISYDDTSFKVVILIEDEIVYWGKHIISLFCYLKRADWKTIKQE